MRGTLYERFIHLYPYHHQVLTAGLTWDETELLMNSPKAFTPKTMGEYTGAAACNNKATLRLLRVKLR